MDFRYEPSAQAAAAIFMALRQTMSLVLYRHDDHWLNLGGNHVSRPVFSETNHRSLSRLYW